MQRVLYDLDVHAAGLAVPAKAAAQLATVPRRAQPAEVHPAGALLKGTVRSLGAATVELSLEIVNVRLEGRRPDDDGVVPNLCSSSHLLLLLTGCCHSLLDQLSHQMTLGDPLGLGFCGQPDARCGIETDHDR